MAIDLHSHSILSDGENTPEELVVMAKEKSLAAFAVSDHDSLEGAKRAMQKGIEIGVNIIPAVEISTSFEGKVLHILAYFIDLNNEKLNQTLEEINEYRKQRAELMIKNINKELKAVGKQLLDRSHIINLGKEKSITRADIAQYLVELGYVQTRNEAFDRWLNKYNIPNKDLTVAEACKIIHGARGIAVLAHPNSHYLSLNEISDNFESHKKIIAGFKKEGLDGVEVYRDDQSEEDQEKYRDFAHSIGLVITGGSDYHGKGYVGSAPSVGAALVPDTVLDELQFLKQNYSLYK